MAQEKLFQTLLELVRRAPWRSEAEERWVTELLSGAEAEARAGETTAEGDPFVAIIPPAPEIVPAPPGQTVSGPEALDYDKLADALLRAQARAAGVPAPADAPPAAPPPAPPEAAQAPPGWLPPVAPDIPAAPVHAGAAAMADPSAVPPPA